jgi:hypothetical protein
MLPTRLRVSNSGGWDDDLNAPRRPGLNLGGPTPPPVPPPPMGGGGGDDGGEPTELGGGEPGARGGQGPRENFPGGGGTATPTRPMTPTPISGGPPVQVTPPIPGPSPASLTSTLRGRGGVYGSQGGLQGGGFGLPFDPTSNQKSDPISDLLKQLLGGGGGAF